MTTSATVLYGIIEETDTTLEFLKNKKGKIRKYPFKEASTRMDGMNRRAARKKPVVTYFLGRFEGT